MLNNEIVHEGWAQYTYDTVDEWLSKIDWQPIVDIRISQFECTSSEVLN